MSNENSKSPAPSDHVQGPSRDDVDRAISTSALEQAERRADGTIINGGIITSLQVLLGMTQWAGAAPSEDVEPTDELVRCDICAKPLNPDDNCATDIELGICHAECLEGSPVVNLDTGEPLPDGELHTYRFGDLDPAPPAVEAVEGRQGDWMQTVSGRQFWPIDPRPEDVHIEDIAHALSMMCRFGGHCDRFYSVAEHSVLLSWKVPQEDALWALLHDASEAYIADIVRPAKRFINGYKEMEVRIMAAVCGAFNLPIIPPPSVKRADTAILADEAAQIMGTKPKDWILPEPPLGVRIIGLTPSAAKRAFLDRFQSLAAPAPEGLTDV